MDIHKVSNSQMDELLDYLSTHRALVKGVGLGARSKELQDRLWEDLAQRLNAHGRGATKTGQRWKRYWISLKHKVKTRATATKQDLYGTGGGPPNQFLNEIDLKVMELIGKPAVFGDGEHRIPVFIDHESSDHVQVPCTSASFTNSCTADRLLSPTFTTLDDTNLINDNNTDAEESQPDNTDVTWTIESAELRTTNSTHPTASERPAKTNKTPRKVEPDWVIALEERRVSSEEKTAEAVHLMAQAANTMAQAANTIAQATSVQVENLKKILDHFCK